MANTAETTEAKSNPWKVIAVGSFASTVAASAFAGLSYYKAVEKDKLLTEEHLAHQQIGIILSREDVIATQLQVDPIDDEYSFIALKTPETLLCEGTYEYDGTTVTVKFGELACHAASTNDATTSF